MHITNMLVFLIKNIMKVKTAAVLSLQLAQLQLSDYWIIQLLDLVN